MKREVILFCLVLLLLILPVSAEIQSLPHPVKTGECVVLPQIYYNSTFQNITTIQNPNASVISINAAMTKSSQSYFNYTYCNNTLNGWYIVNGIGDADGTTISWNYEYLVNPLGQVFTTQQAVLYFVVFIIAFIIFVICFGSAIYIPVENDRDKLTGYILAVNNLKYLKIFLLGISYLLILLMTYLGWMMSYGYLDLPFLGSLFNFAFYFLLILLPILFIIGTYLLIANWVRDEKVQNMLLLGLKVRE